MTAVALTGIGQLVTNAAPVFGAGPWGEIRDAALVVERGRVSWVGAAAELPAADEQLDVAGRCVLPGFVDSHTHPIFAGDRSGDFVARMAGDAYSAGGIQTTVAATRAAPDELLADNLARLAVEMRRQGTTTFEAKSGYGLTVADERRALALARLLTPETTFLGGHVVPEEYAGSKDRADEYVSLVCGSMLREAVPYARWIDVFCEPWSSSAFDKDQARTILEAGRDAGLGLRVHAGQLGLGPGVQLACELGAASADHCTYLDDADVSALADSSVVATLLPGVEFSTRSPYSDARRLLDAGATVALATDCNPGTSYTTSMSFCIALAVRELGMTPAEAVWAATAGGAQALARDDIGTIRPGARADILILDAPDYVHLAYRPGVVLTQVWAPEGIDSADLGDD